MDSIAQRIDQRVLAAWEERTGFPHEFDSDGIVQPIMSPEYKLHTLDQILEELGIELDSEGE